MKFRADLTLRQFGNEYVIVDPGQHQQDISRLVRFNETAAQVWNDLQGEEVTVTKIVAVLQQHYDVCHGVAERGAKHLIAQFVLNGLLTAD